MSSLRLRIMTASDTTIITTRGDIDLHSSPLLDARLTSLIKDHRCVVVNLSHTHYIDSTGLATLLRAHRFLHEAGGQLSVIGCHPSISRVMHVIGFQHLFKVEERSARHGRRAVAAN